MNVAQIVPLNDLIAPTEEQYLAEFVSAYKDLARQEKEIKKAKEDLRAEWTDRIEAYGNNFQCAYGRIEFRAESVRSEYDARLLDNLLADLAKSQPELAARLAGCRSTKIVPGTWAVK